MAQPGFGASEFPVGDCSVCDKEVLTFVDFDDAGSECRRCLHCETTISGRVRWIDSEMLEADGYAVVEARACGNGGGCSAGGCGMRERAVTRPLQD